uniref:Heat shock 70 kDa protein 12A n=1 Tax=Magallana gigas TaxID=29159 RepID=K1PNS5_MAGGI
MCFYSILNESSFNSTNRRFDHIMIPKKDLESLATRDYVEEVKIEELSEEGRFRLTWQCPSEAAVSYYNVYSTANGSKTLLGRSKTHCFYTETKYKGSLSIQPVVQCSVSDLIVKQISVTANVTVHQKCEDNTLEEVLPASGEPLGGKAVDDRFMNFLKELVGENVLEEFKKENMEDYNEITRSFETKKRTIKPDKSGNTRMPIPHALVKLCTKSHGVKSFKEVIQKNDTHRNNVDFITGKLVWNNDFFRGFFKKTIDQIVKYIDEIIRESEARDIRIFVLVGGFSECLLVQDAIKKHFGDVSIIIAEEAGLAVLKGAVFLAKCQMLSRVDQ